MEKTGIRRIQIERNQQIRKHGFTRKRDQSYKAGELIQAAKCCLEKVGHGPGFTNIEHPWPATWDAYHERTISMKDDIGKLVVAGAFYMAENDRTNDDKYTNDILRIASKIDALLSRASSKEEQP